MHQEVDKAWIEERDSNKVFKFCPRCQQVRGVKIEEQKCRGPHCDGVYNQPKKR